MGPLVYVLPLWNPIRVAEEVAMLDNLTEGRLECGGFGARIGPFSFAAYNVPWHNKQEMALEALRVIKGIWTTNRSPSRAVISDAKMWTYRYHWCKEPHPPLWMPTRSKDSLEEAASTGVSTVQRVPAGMAAAGRAFDEYREVYQRVEPTGAKPHIGLMREICCANDREARLEGTYHWKNFWQRRGGARTYGAHGSTRLATILDGSRRHELMDMEHSMPKDHSFAAHRKSLRIKSRRSLGRPEQIPFWANSRSAS